MLKKKNIYILFISLSSFFLHGMLYSLFGKYYIEHFLLLSKSDIVYYKKNTFLLVDKKVKRKKLDITLKKCKDLPTKKVTVFVNGQDKMLTSSVSYFIEKKGGEACSGIILKGLRYTLHKRPTKVILITKMSVKDARVLLKIDLYDGSNEYVNGVPEDNCSWMKYEFNLEPYDKFILSKISEIHIKFKHKVGRFSIVFGSISQNYSEIPKSFWTIFRKKRILAYKRFKKMLHDFRYHSKLLFLYKPYMFTIYLFPLKQTRAHFEIMKKRTKYIRKIIHKVILQHKFNLTKNAEKLIIRLINKSKKIVSKRIIVKGYGIK